MKTLLLILASVAMLGCERQAKQDVMHCVTNKNGYEACTTTQDKVFIPVNKWAPKKIVV